MIDADNLKPCSAYAFAVTVDCH